jgi:putative DNA-invertase from lambdoid prophage Rac
VNVAGYLRVSTELQEHANQRPDIERVCAARGWTVVWYEDVESGAKKRPGWEALKVAVHRGEVGGVVVWALDRAGRDRVQLAHDLAEFARKSCVLVSVREPWLDQPTGPLRTLLISILAWVAESERARLIERTLAGMARAEAGGAVIGRPRAVFDEVLAERMLRSGWSAGAVARKVGVSRPTIVAVAAARGWPIEKKGPWGNQVQRQQSRGVRGP